MDIKVGTVLKHKLEEHPFTIVKVKDGFVYTNRKTVMPMSFFQNERYFEIVVDKDK